VPTASWVFERTAVGGDGFSLLVSGFEGHRVEAKTMLPVIEKFMAVRRLPGVTVVTGVAHAGMISGQPERYRGGGPSFIVVMILDGARPSKPSTATTEAPPNNHVPPNNEIRILRN
jgi:hypothetical protein